MKFLISLLISFALMHYAHSVCTFVQQGDWCSKIESRIGCVSGTLYRLSSAIDNGCTNLKAGDEVCCTATSNYVAPSYVAPSYVAPAAVNYNGNCYTVQAGDTCAVIESRLGWATNTIVNNNAAVNGACSNLVVGQQLCNYNRGINYNNNYNTGYNTNYNNACNNGYYGTGCTAVNAGEGCYDVEKRMGWAVGSIVASGGVNSWCSNLAVGQCVCANAGYYAPATNYNNVCNNGYYGTGCTAVNAGEGCYDVEKRMGWAVGSIVASGGVNSWCSNLAVGQCVCANAGYYAPANNYVAPANNYVAPAVTYTCGRYSTVSVPSVINQQTGQYVSQGYTTCDAVAASLSIAVADLVRVNPGINCASIAHGQQVCF